MKRLSFCLLILLSAILCAFQFSCTNDEVAEQVPNQISQFVAEYYPSYSYDVYTHTKQTYFIRLKNGPGLTFNADMKWIEINGYGQTLTQFFLFDQMPPAVFEYLQESENIENVYAVARDSYSYTVSLFDSVLTYVIATARISVAYG
jgi:hypothetical protein